MFYINTYLKQKIVTVSMNTVATPNLDVNVWFQKSEFPQENFPPSLTQPKVTKQRPFELTDIEYDKNKG